MNFSALTDLSGLHAIHARVRRGQNPILLAEPAAKNLRRDLAMLK